MDDTPTYDKLVADNITAARARHRLSQRAVAERMTALGFEWRQQIVASVETGKRRLTVAEVLGLAYALETSIGVLLEPLPEVPRVALPSGQTLDAASTAWSVRHFNDGTIEWNGNTPVFTEIPEARRQRDVQDASVGPMGRYGRYVTDQKSLRSPSKVGPEMFSNTGPSPEDLDNWRDWKGTGDDFDRKYGHMTEEEFEAEMRKQHRKDDE